MNTTKGKSGDDEAYWAWVRHVEEQWGPGEWAAMRGRLEGLTLAELREVAARVGLKFAIGNDRITDREEFLLALDEAEKDELGAALEAALEKRAAP